MDKVQYINPDFLAPKDAWDRLSIQEKAAMMKVAVNHGITNLQDIRAKYNELAEGGPVDTDWSYNSWKRQVAEHMGIRPDEDNTYDYEAYFNKYPEEAWKMLKGDPTAHFSDEFKTVYHPTFSSKSIGNDGSIYSGVRNPKTNPQGLVGGTWSPDYNTFTMSPDGYRGPVSMDDRKWYLENAEDNGVVLREADGSLPIYDGIPWGGVLPNVTVYGNKHAEGGNLFGEGGGVSGLMPALSFATIDWKKAAEKARNLYEYGKSYIKHKLEGDGEGEVIDLSKKKVSRIKSGTNNVTSILTNDFVEHNNNMVRKKKDFVNTTDTLLGDREIPLSKISTFYGIEDGKLKAGPLSIFNDTTTVVPNRAKNIGKIKEYYPGKPGSKEALAKRREAINKEIAEYNNSKGYEPDWLSKMLPFIPGAQPREVLHHNLIKEEGNNRIGRLRARKRYDDILRSMGDKYSYLVDSEPTRVITENNDTIIGYDLNASPKTLFADENGNAVFVAQPRQHAEELNSYLQEHPMYPIMVDNGRYAAYQTHFPNAEVYGGLNRPDDMFIIGTTKALGGNLFKGGGSIVSDKLVDMTIKEEGFNKQPEDIGDGKMTLGSGLTASKWHDLYKKRGNKWSAADNRRAVRQELSDRERWAKSNIPNWKGLPDSSKEALLMYKYNYDFNRANSPKLFAALEAGNLQEAARQMDATSKDPKFQKGLMNRRKREQALFLSEVPVTGAAPRDITIQSPVSTYVQNPYATQQQNTVQLPQYVPAENEYVRTVELSPEQQRANALKERFDQINRFNRLMELFGVKNTAVPAFMPESGVTMLDDIWNNERAKGGKIFIKPSHRGRLTELKKRTGKTEAELYRTGSPATRKMITFARNARKWKHGLGGDLNTYNYGNTFGGGGLFGNETVDTMASFLPIVGTAEDAYQFYKDPSWANAGWLALSLGSDIFTGGMAARGIKALRMADKAHDAAQVANRAARRTWEAGKAANTAQSGSVRGADMRRRINSVKAAGATKQAAIRRANDALFEVDVATGVDQGLNGFINAAQMDMLPTFGYDNKHGLGGNLYSGGGFASLVTTPVLPDIKEVRHRLYNGVNPAGYQEIPERIWDALNKKEANRDIYRDDQWATYLQIPEEERHSGVEKLQPARYRPSIGNTNGDVYRMPLNEEDTDVLIQRAQLSGLGIGENMVDRSLAHYFGDHTVGRGHDKKGEYISYYDKYDLNPFTGGTPVKTGVRSIDRWLQTTTSLPNIDLSLGIGKPFEIYDRIYLDDYYGVPKEARDGNFLPEITVTGKKRKKSLGGEQ